MCLIISLTLKSKILRARLLTLRPTKTKGPSLLSMWPANEGWHQQTIRHSLRCITNSNRMASKSSLSLAINFSIKKMDLQNKSDSSSKPVITQNSLFSKRLKLMVLKLIQSTNIWGLKVSYSIKLKIIQSWSLGTFPNSSWIIKAKL